MDPTHANIDNDAFEKQNWCEFYGNVKEQLPANASQSRGKPAEIRCFVDADHAGDKLTRRSRTGVIIFLNGAPVIWYSKKQNTVESSTFGSEYVAMRTALELIEGLRYKLRMMGIPCTGPAYILGDNQSVLANTSIPDSTLKKKNQSIAYHFIREGSARDEWRTSYVNTHNNEADLLTKLLPSGDKRKGFVRRLLHHIFG